MAEIPRVHHSPYSFEIPNVDVPTFIFTAGTPVSRDRPQYFDADSPSRNFSLREAEIYVKQFAKGLQNLGLQQGDRILLCSSNTLYFPVFFWGTIAGGYVFTGCTSDASVTELAYQMKDSGAKAIFASSDDTDKALSAAKQAPVDPSFVFEFNAVGSEPTSSCRGWTTLWESEGRSRDWKWRTFENRGGAENTVAVINYSSGTTGLPKGVEITHRNLVANTMQVLCKMNIVGETVTGRARKARLELHGERWLAPLPMFHAFGQTYFCMTAAVGGAKVFVMPKYDMRRWLLYLDTYRITFMTGVPALLVSLSKHPEAHNFNLNALETVVTGSAPLSAEVGKVISERLLRPGVRVKQGWGMTECTSAATGFASDDDDDGRSVGWPNPNMSISINPISGGEYAAGSQSAGEIWVSGPTVMKGYHGKPEETAATIVNKDSQRWLRTGDIGYVDDRGFVYIIDRMKELIKVKGFQVAPTELEQTLLLHPGVAEVAVIGHKINEGEYPKAFVVKKHENVIASELLQFIEARLSKYKWLTGGLVFVESLPRTASGKVIRRALTKLANERVGDASKL